MDKPLASCVCVTFNRPQLIGELLYCFLAQDYENKELIILNDQKDIQYQYDDPRVKIINLDERFPSLGAKRNYSRSLTNGDFIFIMDDDDLYFSNHISKLLGYYLEHPHYDVIANQEREYSEWNEGLSIISNYDHYVPFNGAMITKEYWDKTEFPNEKSCGEDRDYVKDAEIIYIEGKTTFHYRWGLDIHHISGLGGDGRISYAVVTYETPVGDLRVIEIEPKLSTKTQKYYR